MLDFDQSARLSGVRAGDGPLDMANGSMVDAVQFTNEWWVRLGLMDNVVDAASGIDCSLTDDLVAAGLRQSLAPHQWTAGAMAAA